MTIILTLSVVALALILFISEWLPVDISALAIAIILILLGLVTPEEGISGFSDSATITVMAMFMLSAGITRTGVIQSLSELLIRWGGKNSSQQIMALGAIVGPITAFINNTAVVAVFLPVVEDWCRKRGISPSKLLIPLSFATVLGGMITTIGTSTNVVASGLSAKLGYGEFKLFQFTQLGIITFAIGLIYLTLVAPKLLPDRKQPNSDLLNQEYDLRDYVSEIVITPGSKLVGETLNSSGLQRKFDIDILEAIVNDIHFHQPLDNKKLLVGTILLVRASRQDLLKIREEEGIEILADVKFQDRPLTTELISDEEGVAQALIPSNSSFIDSNLQELKFRQRYNTTVLAIRRGEKLTRERMGKTKLRFGDVLLLQGAKQSLSGLHSSQDLLIVCQQNLETLRRDKAAIAVAIVLGVIVAAAFNWLPILVTSLVGVILMVITGCLKPREIYQAVRWDIIFLLAGLIPLGIAMNQSGATQWLADSLVALGGDRLSGYWLLTFFYIITSLITEILSNNASVVLLLPIAVEVAKNLNFNPLAFMFVVTFAASNSYLTPIGYQTNTMVYGPGGYKFTDFTRIGLPLNILLTLITPPLIIWLYGL